MDQENQNNTPDGSGDVPLKRKRGRPRKYARPDSEDSSHIVHRYNRQHNFVSGQQAPVPPGVEGVNGSQNLQRNPENEPSDAMIGQTVSGVIESVFDAGYLLNVRVGDSDTTLRGLVFKPGRYVPISPDNDVAPGVPMIRRSEVPFPSGTAQFQTPLPKARTERNVNVTNENRTTNGSPSVPQVPRAAIGSAISVSALGKNVPSVAGQTTPQLPRGNVVPVVFQPGNFSNGVPVSNQPLQGTMMTQVSVGSEKSVPQEIPVDANQVPTPQAQTSNNMLSSGMQSKGVPQYQCSSSNLPNLQARTATLPFEQLMSEVVKRTDATDAVTGNGESGDKTQLKDHAVLIQPLQAIQSHPQENSASALKSTDYPKTVTMTELLQISQDNETENQASKAAELGSGQKLLGLEAEKLLDLQNLSEQ